MAINPTPIKYNKNGKQNQLQNITYEFSNTLTFDFHIGSILYTSGSQTFQIILQGDPLQHTFLNQGPLGGYILCYDVSQKHTEMLNWQHHLQHKEVK